MANPLPDTATRFGAQLGRHDEVALLLTTDRVQLQRVYLDSGGYDRGGSYWGHGTPLYTYGNGAGWNYLRAVDRDAAKAAIRKRHGDAVKFLR